MITSYFYFYFLFLKSRVLTALLIDRLNQKSTSHDEAVNVLRSTITVLDKEKDSLQETVDEKTERIACLDDNLANKVCTVTTSPSIWGFVKPLDFRETFCLDNKTWAEL